MATHRGGNYILSLLPTPVAKADADSLLLTSLSAGALSAALNEDAKDYFYAACVTLVDGIQGCERGMYTWATVKCYYSVFYSLRAWLASDGLCLFYVRHGTGPKLKVSGYWLQSRAGQTPFNCGSGGTHKAVLTRFARDNSGHRLVRNPIATISPLEWLMNRREDCNYNIARCVEPGAPHHFAEVDNHGVRAMLSRYMADTRDIYAFSVDHAMLAYPLAVLIETGNYLQSRGGTGIDPEELAFLIQRCSDNLGAMTALTNVLGSLS